MKRICIFGLALLTSCSFLDDGEKKALLDPLVEERKTFIDSYEPTTGTWEGTFFVTSAPEGLMETLALSGTDEHGVRIRVTLSDENEAAVALRYPDDDSWKAIDGPAKYFSNNMGWQINIERSGGVWIEKFSITFDRVKEREAALTFTRTVHNWYVVDGVPDVVDFYHMFGAGRATRVDGLFAIEQ